MAEQLILLRDGMAYSYESKLLASSPIEDFIEVLNDRHTVNPVFLPHADRGCAAYARYGQQQMFLMYLEPQKRSFVYNLRDAAKTQRLYTVTNPHWYLAVFFNKNAIADGYALVAKRQLQSIDDAIGPMPVPNIYEGPGKICWGTGAWQINKSPIENAPMCVDYFLKSEFNSDIVAHFKLVPPELQVPANQVANNPNESNCKFFELWEKLSAEKSVADICSLDWKTPSTLRDLLGHVWQAPLPKRRVTS